MTTRCRVLVISTNDHGRFPLALQRRSGEPLAVHHADPTGWVAAVRDQEWDYVISQPELLREHAFERGQREVLELIASGAPLAEQLEQIVLLIEAQAPRMICSILLLDRDRNTLTTGAAPNLPADFIRAIDGSKIGPRAGSCGAAAYENQPVIVEDIATHPYWDDYRHLALPHGLRACWSTPIRSGRREVLGTFAMYYTEVRGPGPDELHWVERATHIAAITIERALADANQRLHAKVHDLIADAIFYLSVERDEQYRFVSVNPAFCEATGMREREIVGRRIDEVIPEPSLSEVRSRYAQAITEQRTVTWYDVSPYPAGIKHGLTNITPILTVDGHCVNLVGTIHDITELYAAQTRIAAQAELLDRAHDAILAWDLAGTIKYWNRAAELLYGWSRAEAVGRAVAALIHPDSSQFDAAQQYLLEADSFRGELIQHDQAGIMLIIEASWSLVRDEQGAPKCVLAIHCDMTERRRLEQQLYRAQRLESLGVMASGIAHDFNNILTVIGSNAELAGAASNSADAREALAQIEVASERGADLVRQLLTFSRRQESPRELVDLGQVVTDALALLRTSLPGLVQLRTELAADVPAVVADRTQLHQVVINLVTNAAHAMAPEGGVVDVRVDHVTVESEAEGLELDLEPGTYARLRIRDTGTGMSDATLARIFEPFFTTKACGEGTGLGLAVVHKIVEGHHGKIVVRSTLGVGTEFEVYLPVDE